jgi:hypothetical protein
MTLRREKTKKWLLKDNTLTNSQLKELIGASDHIIRDVRKELNLPCPTALISRTQVREAFKKYMNELGKTLDNSPWKVR